MATINLRVQADGDLLRPFGSITTARTFTVDEVSDQTLVLANLKTWDVWSAVATDDPGHESFVVGIFQSSGAAFIEITVDKDGDVGTETMAIGLAAGEPFIITSNIAKALYTADFAAGTDDVIDRIRIRTENGAANTVRAIIGSND